MAGPRLTHPRTNHGNPHVRSDHEPGTTALFYTALLDPTQRAPGALREW